MTNGMGIVCLVRLMIGILQEEFRFVSFRNKIRIHVSTEVLNSDKEAKLYIDLHYNSHNYF